MAAAASKKGSGFRVPGSGLSSARTPEAGTRNPVPAPTVFIVDDDEAVRNSLRWLVESGGLRVAEFDSAKAFLGKFDPASCGCLVLDVRMSGMTGIELLQHLRDQGHDIPTVIITAHGDVPMAVHAMKLGAVDFIEKPLNYQQLLERIQAAMKHDARRRDAARDAAAVGRCLDTLTQRERQVLDGVVAGKMNKQIADELHISAKTVEMHRGHVMKKMQAKSLAQLVRMAVTANPENPGSDSGEG